MEELFHIRTGHGQVNLHQRIRLSGWCLRIGAHPFPLISRLTSCFIFDPVYTS